MSFRSGQMRQIPEEMLTVTGEVVSTYDSQQGAQHAVDVLVEEGFAANTLAIIGHGITTVERVTAKLTYGKVALTGAFSGIYFGVGISLITVLVGLADPQNLVNTLAACMVIGIGLGVLFAVVSYALNRNRRGYLSVGGLRAVRYDLIAPRGKIGQARKILAHHAEAQH